MWSGGIGTAGMAAVAIGFAVLLAITVTHLTERRLYRVIEHTMYENRLSPCPDRQPAMAENFPFCTGKILESVPHIAAKGEFDMVDTRGYICPPGADGAEALKDRPATVEVLAEAGAAVENITRFAHSQATRWPRRRTGRTSS